MAPMEVPKAEVERRFDRFTAACRKAGVKLTHQRLEIFREVAGSVDHPDAEAVFRAVQPRLSTVSLDTVYRTLWLLSELGVVRPLGPRRESVRFDANLNQHHHYVCIRCGLTRDFESHSLDTVKIPPAVHDFGTVLATHMEVRGLCAACSKVETAAKPAKEVQQRDERKKKA
jgi:Fur family transcriptional regulator, peroxide stress response regulator